MVDKQITYRMVLGAIVLIAAGCGGTEDDSSARGNVVITPSAEAEAETPAEEAPDQAAGDSTASTAEPTDATDSPEPAPTAETEQETPEPAQSTTVATADDAITDASAKPEPAAEPSADKGTTFKGRVVVKGTPPPINPIRPSGNDPFCINLDEIKDDSVVIGEGGGLADVFVWLRKIPSDVDVPSPPEEPVVLDQKGCRFFPQALIIQAGQSLLLKNDDATLHNTKMGGFKNSFNLAVSPNNRTGEEVKIEHAEIIPIPVECNVHAWMSARVLATDNPWHAVTDENGNFEINNLPSGVELEFRLHHGKVGYVEKSVELTLADGEVKEQTFEVDAAKLSD